MNSIAVKKIWWLLPIAFILLLGLTLYLEEVIFAETIFLACLGAVGLYLVLFKKELFFSLCVLFIPLSVTTELGGGADLAAPSELMTLVLALVALYLGISRPMFFKKILSHPLTLLLVLDIAWMLLTALVSDIYIYSVKRVVARALFLLVFYLLAAQWMVKKENMVKFFLLYALGLIIPIIVTEYNHSIYNFNPKTVFELCKPFYSEHTVYGACIAYVLPFLLILAMKARSFGFTKGMVVFSWILFIIFLAAEILSFSRAAWISLAVSLLMFIFLKLHLRFWHFILLLAGVTAIFLYYQEPLYVMARDNDNVSNRGEIGEHIMSVSNLNTDASNMERINRWSCAMRMYHDRPYTGFGPGTYQFTYGPYQSVYEMTPISTMAGDKGNAHSEPLTYLSETGLPGFISYLLWMLGSIGFGIRAYYRAKDPLVKNMALAALLGFVTFFFHGLVNSFIDQVKMASLVFGSMAMIMVADIVTRTKQREAKHIAD